MYIYFDRNNILLREKGNTEERVRFLKQGEEKKNERDNNLKEIMFIPVRRIP